MNTYLIGLCGKKKKQTNTQKCKNGCIINAIP